MLQRHPTDPDAARWLPGARLNVAHAALHCPLAPPGAPALLWARDGAPTRLHAVGREELRRRVEQVAASVRQRFKPGACRAGRRVGCRAGGAWVQRGCRVRCRVGCWLGWRLQGRHRVGTG